MKIIVNGIEKECNDTTTLLELLENLQLTGKVMAAAINMEIVKQDQWSSCILKDGDKVELLDFVGGG